MNNERGSGNCSSGDITGFDSAEIAAEVNQAVTFVADINIADLCHKDIVCADFLHLRHHAFQTGQ